MEDLKKEAEKFCEKIDWCELEDIELCAQFAQYLLDKGMLVEANKVDKNTLQKALEYMKHEISSSIVYEDFHDFSKGIKGCEIDYIPETVEELAQEMNVKFAESTVSSAGKEVTDEYNDCPIDAAGLLADIDIFRVLNLPNEAIARIELYTQSKINQFKSSPASTEHIEKLEQLKNMIKGHESLIKSLGKEIDSLKSQNVISDEEVDTPKCEKCGSRTALVNGTFYWEADTEPYNNGAKEPAVNNEGEHYSHGYVCDSCDHIMGMWHEG